MTAQSLNLSRLTPSLPDLVYDQIRNMLLAGRFHPGEVLRQEKLAALLGVSRVPLREALRRLEAEGLVELQDRRGYLVASLNWDEIEEVFRLRMFAEGRAGMLATRRRTQADIDAVESYLERLEGLDPGDDPERIAEWAALNREFHNTLYEACRHRALMRVINMLRDSVERYVRVEVLMTGNAREAQREHHKMFALFKKGDAEGVRDICRAHCRHTAERLLSNLTGSPVRLLDEDK